MNTTANIAYFQDRRKAGFAYKKLLTTANQKAYELIDELTEGFTEMENIEADASFEKSFDLLVAAMKAASGPTKVEADKPAKKKQKLTPAQAERNDKKGRAKKALRTAKASTGKSAKAKTFAERMRLARAAKKAETKESSEKPAAARAAGAKKTASTGKKAKESTVKATKVAATKKPTKAQIAEADYKKASKVGSLSEEVKQIKKFVGLVKKSTKEQIISAAKGLNKAAATRKITLKSDHAAEIKQIQQAYFDAAKSGKKLAVSDAELAHLVQIAGGQKVYKSVDVVNRFIGWANTERTAEQVKKFLTEIKNAHSKISDSDPYAGQVKQIISALSAVKSKTTFKLQNTALSGLAGTMGCLCDQKKPLAGTKKAVAKPKKRAKVGKKSLSGLPGEEAVIDGGSLDNVPTRMIEGRQLAVKPRWPATMSAHEVMAIDYPTYDFKNDPATNEWGTLFGKPQKPFTAMFSGAPGSGKSTLLMQLSVYLTKHFGKTLYISSEEYPSFTLADKLERAGGAVKGLAFAKTLAEIDKSYEFVIIDSSNHVHLTLKDFVKLKEDYPKTSFILILQYTKDGQFRGGNEWPHEVDAVFKIEAGTVFTTKNRFVREMGTIQVFND